MFQLARKLSNCARLLALSGLFACISFVPNLAFSEGDIDGLLAKAARELDVAGPEAAKNDLEELSKYEMSMSPHQQGTFFKLRSSAFALRAMYKDQVQSSIDALKVVVDPDLRASILYYLADGYSSMGEYEKALQAMNESIELLPKLTQLESKIEVLQSAFALLESMRAYEESSSYAERLISLQSNDSSTPACVGLADLIEIAFLQHDGERARSLMPKEIEACESRGHKNIQLSVEALNQVDLLGASGDGRILTDSVSLLNTLTRDSAGSEYSIRLADAIAKRQLLNGQLAKAEQFAAHATQWANSGSGIQLQQQTSETMASILRSEGKIEQALSYMETSNKLWAKLLEESGRKEVAYQRMKFKAQDQSNQLKLLSKINNLLTTERELQDRNKQSLQLLVFVTVLLLAFVSIWLVRTWRQKNDFRTYSQIDGLTKISNRAHFIACAHQAFKDARGTISIVLFDMDEFKLINDTYSHAAGDWVLKTVSATISSCLRSQDLFGRLGGEEFAICLPHTSEADATALAERCRSAIEAIDSSSSGHQFSLSASFGIAVRPPNGSAGFEEVLAAADRALYQAKHMGRNRIAPYGEVLGHSPLVASS